MEGALDDGVGLGVGGPQAVPVDEDAAGFGAVGDPARRAVVAVVRIRRSRVSTAPTLARGQVARVATVRAISMKYWSQPGRAIQLS